MNQRIADFIRALPAPFRSTVVLGWILLILCFLCYVYWVRPALWRYIRAHTTQKMRDTLLIRPTATWFFSPLKRKAHLEQCGWYTVNRCLLPALIVGAGCHMAATVLCLALPAWHSTAVHTVDCAILSLLFFAVTVIALISQPAATLERRAKWGFRPFGNVVHALLWEAIVVVLLFFWLYVAYFLTLLSQ